MYLEQLEPGTRFKTMSGKEGTLLKLGLGSATVKWHGTETTRTFTPQAKPGETPKKVTVKTAAVEEYIALRTEVTIMQESTETVT